MSSQHTKSWFLVSRIGAVVGLGLVVAACSVNTGTLATGALPVAADEEVVDPAFVDPLFTPIFDELVETSGVPPRLPADLGFVDADDVTIEVAATLVASSADGYDVVIGFGECPGGNACRIGTFAGTRAEVAVSAEGVGQPVPLPNGITGEFFPATCGATCGDSTVRWEENGIVYTVGEKVGTGTRVLELAWQAVDSTATLPAQPVSCGTETIRDRERAATVVTNEETGLNWIVVCSGAGTSTALAAGPGTLSWVDLDGDNSNDLQLDFEGRSWQFTVLSESNIIAPLWQTT